MENKHFFACQTVRIGFNILFDFFTPIRGVKEELWLTFEERDEVLKKLKELKRVYGDFIGGPPRLFCFYFFELGRTYAVGLKDISWMS